MSGRSPGSASPAKAPASPRSRPAPVLGASSAAGADLHLLCIAERALREGGEPAQRSISTSNMSTRTARSSVAGKHVEQPAAHRELAPAPRPGHPLVARRTSSAAHSSSRAAPPPAARTTVASATGRAPSRERDGADDDDGLLRSGLSLPDRARAARQERRPAADEVRRRREMGLIGHASRGVVADPPRREPAFQVARPPPLLCRSSPRPRGWAARACSSRSLIAAIR